LQWEHHIRIAVDTGGTFTDLVMLDGSGITVHKVRSTADDPARAILAGVHELLESRLLPVQQTIEIIHGSTVATNALLERKGARIAFVTTAGFEDVLRIGRQTRGELYNFFVKDRQPLVEEGLTFGIEERMDAHGSVINPLCESKVASLVARLTEVKPAAVAICLLHSYANPEHEQRLAHAISDIGIPVSASYNILPEYREFERASTTAINAYVSPVMSRYLTTLEESLTSGSLRIMQSAGGFVSADHARARAVETILSGPAAGAIGAFAIAQVSGYNRVIAFDMGGTSTDVSLLDGSLPMTAESEIGGFPVRLPMLDIHTVGAGGGSITYVDPGGALRVGPRSAGAVPGPACYGVGEELTVTDANLLLGRLDPSSFLGGRMPLDTERPRRLARELARKVGLNETELAEGIIRVANSNMERALRVVSLERGYDPRDFALLAFGGAGGMHACDLACALDMHTVLVPEHAGVLSALGMLLSDWTRHYSRTVLCPADQMSYNDLEHAFAQLSAAARSDLRGEGFEDSATTVEHSLDLRYLGQSYEITVPFVEGYRHEFDRIHERLYGYCNERRRVEIVNVRLRAVGRTIKPELPKCGATASVAARPTTARQAIFSGRTRETPLFLRHLLQPGMCGAGPAVISAAQSTTVVPPDWRFSVDGAGTLVLTWQTVNRPSR
jgi:N-methylhydantoinase A/oxoprolinase/acetone carboxylase beta subunit